MGNTRNDPVKLLKAFVVADEINLNALAKRYGIPRKYTWEEPLILDAGRLGPGPEDRKAFVFAFGSVVLVNFPDDGIRGFLEGLKDVCSGETLRVADMVTDEYEIRHGGDEGFDITDEHALVPSEGSMYEELAATVIAKSAALEKLELLLGRIEEKVEAMLDQLGHGRANLPNSEVARTTSDILRIQYTTISYIMLLDKPDSTWESSEANQFHDSMADFFELSDRFEINSRKLEILNAIKEGFTQISFSNRGLKLEWAIIILIVLEVIIMLIELLK